MKEARYPFIAMNYKFMHGIQILLDKERIKIEEF